MTDFHSRFKVRVKPGDGQRPPKHVSIQDVRPDPEGYYNFPFLIRRPAIPNATPAGFCRYVEDFEDRYGKSNVVVEAMGPLNEDWLASIQRASTADEESQE